MSEFVPVFEQLNALNVNGHTDKKKSGNVELTYLSWPWAWAEVKKRFEDASYTIWKDEHNRPYILDPETGYMVYTSVTIGGITHEMWLPVMDGANKAMRNVPYKYMTKYNGEKTCDAATMMDINKAIMRCLVKNLAMFGLGLYIYAGEDLPDGDETKDEPEKKPVAKDTPAVVTTADKIPVLDVSTPMGYLQNELGFMAKQYKVTPAEMRSRFNVNKKSLVKAGLAPDKEIKDYTMDEVKAICEAIIKNFPPEAK